MEFDIKQTPMMDQYLKFKKQYPDKIVLFRMGDFFETFGQDAKINLKYLTLHLLQGIKTVTLLHLQDFLIRH
jgi:DNA mismatch repair ATPase MutS